MINIELNRQTTLAVIILAASLFSSVAFALPNKMPINGRLTFSNDTDINGTANFTFKIYNNKTGSAALWQESQQNLTVRRGLFSAYLGNNTPINLTFDENYFLEIVVNGETIEPRFDFGRNGNLGERFGGEKGKDLVEGAPKTLKEGVNKEDAAKIKEQIEKAGAKVEIK